MKEGNDGTWILILIIVVILAFVFGGSWGMKITNDSWKMSIEVVSSGEFERRSREHTLTDTWGDFDLEKMEFLHHAFNDSTWTVYKHKED